MSENIIQQNSQDTTQQENNRGEDGRFLPGFSGNPGGRVKGSIKEWLQARLSKMTPEEKEEWLKGISKELQWQMAEGRPQQQQELTHLIPKPLDDVSEPAKKDIIEAKETIDDLLT